MLSLLSVLSLALFSSCSTEKAKWTNIRYHNITTHYNVWWNGNERPESRRVPDSEGPAPTACQVQRPRIPAEAPEAGGSLWETRPDRPVAAAGEQGAGPPPDPRSGSGSDTRCSPGAPYLLRAAVAAGGALSQASAARDRSTEAAAVATTKDNQQPAGFGTATAGAGLGSREPGPPPRLQPRVTAWVPARRGAEPGPEGRGVKAPPTGREHGGCRIRGAW